MFGEPSTYFNLTVNHVYLKTHNLSISDVHHGDIIFGDSDLPEEIIVKNNTYELNLEPRTLLRGLAGNPDSYLEDFLFNNATIDDMKEDANLVPQPSYFTVWRDPLTLPLSRLKINATGSSVSVFVNGKKKYENILTKFQQKVYQKVGVLMLVINPQLGQVTFSELFFTSEFGGYRDLLMILERTSPGRLVVMSSLGFGSVQLYHAYQTLKSHGSEWASYFSFGDFWLFAFFKNGKTVIESLIPSVVRVGLLASPVIAEVDFQSTNMRFTEDKCLKWPDTTLWKAREIFCRHNDGYGSLCNCNQPFLIRGQKLADTKRKKITTFYQEDIPIIIIAGNRTRYLIRLLQSLATQPGVSAQSILVVSDGQQEDVGKICYILGLKNLVHKPEGSKAPRISRNFRFALFNALKEFPNVTTFIVLEDDLIVSPDFYSFMQQTSPIFSMDSSVYCVSAFSHTSYSHTAHDATMLYRAHTAPAYGWMTSRKFLVEILPKWLPATLDHDWDMFMLHSPVRKSRECIIPDINRSCHGGSTGLHLNAAWMNERDYLSKPMNNKSDVRLMDIRRLTKDNYEKEIEALLKEATPVIVDNNEKLIFPPSKMLGIWSRDCRDQHHFTWRLNYKGKMLFVVGVPKSKYSKFWTPKYGIIMANNSTLEQLKMVYVSPYYQIKVKIRKDLSFIPLGDTLIDV